MRILHIALALYALNLGVGSIAQLRHAHFGRAHHVLYAIVFAGAIATAVFEFHPGLVVTLVALAGLPLTKPGRAIHAIVAVVGFLGYLIALAA